MAGFFFTLLALIFAVGAFSLNEEANMARHNKAPQIYTPGWPAAKPDGTPNWACAVGEALAWALLVAVALLLLAGAGAALG
jgi:hypothetical protein